MYAGRARCGLYCTSDSVTGGGDDLHSGGKGGRGISRATGVRANKVDSNIFVPHGSLKRVSNGVVNPLLEPIIGIEHTLAKGYLFLPDLSRAVPRFQRIHYSGLDLSGWIIVQPPR